MRPLRVGYRYRYLYIIILCARVYANLIKQNIKKYLFFFWTSNITSSTVYVSVWCILLLLLSLLLRSRCRGPYINIIHLRHVLARKVHNMHQPAAGTFDRPRQFVYIILLLWTYNINIYTYKRASFWRTYVFKNILLLLSKSFRIKLSPVYHLQLPTNYDIVRVCAHYNDVISYWSNT